MTGPRGATAIRIVADQAIRNVNHPRCAAKGDWRKVSTRRLFWLLLLEVWELLWAVRAYQLAVDEYRILRRCFVDIDDYHIAVDTAINEMHTAEANLRHEAGDCVAFVAFILDKTLGV